MVTAGVFLVARMSPLFEHSPVALTVVVVIGAATAFFAATIGLCQNDIKRVIAYSTCSQLGYMFFACGVSAYSAGIFHLMTHAFFKALLFLGAGSVIHAMSSEQDMRKMGGLYTLIPLTYGLMWVGSLALAGIPIFAGFYSKDVIIESAFGAHTIAGDFAFWAGIAAAFMTAFYSWRLLIMTFHGTARADERTMAHVHESPRSMTVPLIVLAIGADVLGHAGLPLFRRRRSRGILGRLRSSSCRATTRSRTPTIRRSGSSPCRSRSRSAGSRSPTGSTCSGRPSPASWPAGSARSTASCSTSGTSTSSMTGFSSVRRTGSGAACGKEGDGTLIDGLGPDGLSAVARVLARRVSMLQSGYVYHYAFAMLIGVAAFVTWYLYAHG